MEYRNILTDSFDNFLGTIINRELNNDNIFSNIIIAGGAWEHWFKFELINQLSNILNRSSNYSYSIEPEKNFIDITISKNENNQWIPESIIELKITGNWHIIEKQLDNIVADIDKLENNQILSRNKFSLIFNTYVKPKHEIVKWIDEQVLNGLGESDHDKFHRRIVDYIKSNKNYPISILGNKSYSNGIFEQVILSGFLIEVKN